MKNKSLFKILVGSAVFSITLVIIFGIAALVTVSTYSRDEKIWNNGICKCGGNWEFVNGSYARGRGTIYFYECDKCKDVFDSTTHWTINENI